MTGNQIIKALKSSKQPVYGAVTGVDSTFYIKVVKADIVEVLSPYGDKDCGLEINERAGCLYLERTY
jgi:hypothetical protein